MSESKPRGYFEQSSDLTNSLIMITPLLLLYEVGLLVTRFETLNGVDFATITVLHYGGFRGLIGFNVAVLAGISVAAAMRRREHALSPGILPRLLVESTFYAFASAFVVSAIVGALPLGPPSGMTPIEGFFASLGAGVNEELFFRLFLYKTLAWVLARGKKENEVACIIAAILSSVAFSAAHYMGGESFRVVSFVDRFLFGLVFCALLEWRGLAVAVYTHAIFDIYVLVVLALISR